MLIPQSTFTWAWGSALAVAVLAGVYFKLTGLALFRRGQQWVGFKRVSVALAIAAAAVTVFNVFEHRGNDVWVYRESQGRAVGREFVLFGTAKVPMRDSQSLEVVEEPRRSDHGTVVVVNGSSRSLWVPLGYREGKHVRLDSGLILKTTDYFFGDAEPVK